ncbi:MAG TPA: DUF2931 family protein [Marinobacter antarcticus]|uniref:DUF2931 family protein n=2 Tax=Marinobacter antarcticus TaxID=564117 RepID=A0A831R5P1_9GAMM|nr:DUF2931 family protein [Marinobacter antarcticus]
METNMGIKRWMFSLCILVLVGCSESTELEGSRHGPNGTYRSIGVVAPKHYDVWVDKFFVESLSEDIGWRAPIGIVSCCWQKPFGAMADWQTMPEVFLIRWFSFAEQQSYEALIQLESPDEIEEKMKEIAPFESYGEIAERPRDVLVLGLAPGGTVVVWIMNRGENAIEVGRYQGKKIETHREHYREITERYNHDHGQFLQENGIELEGW